MHADESGQAALEMALALPALLVVLVGAVQFALVQHARSVAHTAAAEGARLASADGHTLIDGAVRTHEVLEAGLGRSASALSVQSRERDGRVVTRVSGRYRLFIPWVSELHVRVEVGSEVLKEGLRGGR